MNYLATMLAKLRAVVDFLKRNVGTLDEVGKILAEIQAAVEAANNFFKTSGAARSAQEGAGPTCEEAVAECEELRDELLAADTEEKKVTCKAVVKGGVDWFAIFAPLVLQVIQKILESLRK